MDKNINSDSKHLVFLSKSDLRGGAAIVTYRLVVALRKEGYDAQMLVCEKLSDADFVKVCAPALKIKYEFLRERLKVYTQNGKNRDTLFKIDPASNGLPLWEHTLVKKADAIFLGWVNQGMLSLKGVKKLCSLKKPVIWIMHDMWNMTGICHHAGECTGFHHECGDCPLLGDKANNSDLSHDIWLEKESAYSYSNLKFVAVSKWLAGKALESSLMRNLTVKVIPNAFDIDTEPEKEIANEGPVKIIFGSARLDDPIKDLPVLKKALKIIKDRYQEIANDLELITFGDFKFSGNNEGFSIKHTHLGVLKGQDALHQAYAQCGIVVSTSDYETLPGTLIEGQAYGCIPVALNHGGQGDIIEHKINGWLAKWNASPAIRAEGIAEGILWAYNICKSNDITVFIDKMRYSVRKKFNSERVVRQILDMI